MSEPKKQCRCLVSIRLRGSARVDPELQKTFDSLRLKSKYSAVVVYDTPDIKGMLQKVKDNITWGEISSETLSKLLRIKGSVTGISRIDDEYVKKVFPKYESIEKLAASVTEGYIGLHDLKRVGIKLVFRLHPPKGGFKKSIKRPYKDEGELGYRGSKINNLLENMI